MLEEFTIIAQNGKTFREFSKDYNVNMTGLVRTLHKKGTSCPCANGMFSFIPFDNLDEVKKFEQEHEVTFKRCGNCFRQGKK